MFFFQAEDGIRDLVRSRGLGDVYKRQLTLTGGGQTGDIGSSLNMPVTISPAGAAGTLKLLSLIHI